MKFKFFGLFTCLFISAAAFASHDAVVSLHLSDKEKPEYDFFCSGVLVAPDKVLTTGHCIDVMATEVYQRGNIFSYHPELIKVKIAGIKYVVSDVIIAPSYYESPGFAGEDLAMIQLKIPSKVKPYDMAPKPMLKLNMPVLMVSRSRKIQSRITSVKSFKGNKVVFTENCLDESGGALLVMSGKELLLAGILSAQSEGCQRNAGTSIYPRLIK